MPDDDHEASTADPLERHVLALSAASAVLEEAPIRREACASSLQRASDSHPWLSRLPSKAHAGLIVEPVLLASVRAPLLNYVPAMPRRIVKAGVLSELQLEAVLHAGQCHSQPLQPNGCRPGFLLADGAGVGKGRTQAAIILDAWLQVRPSVSVRMEALHPSKDGDSNFCCRCKDANEPGTYTHASCPVPLPPACTHRSVVMSFGGYTVCSALPCADRSLLSTHMASCLSSQGHQKALWISASSDLFADAQRDLRAVCTAVSGVPPLHRLITPLPKELNAPIPTSRGIIFVSYTLLARPGRLAQLLAWCTARGPFQGVVTLDECHRAKVRVQALYGEACCQDTGRPGVEKPFAPPC